MIRPPPPPATQTQNPATPPPPADRAVDIGAALRLYFERHSAKNKRAL